MPLSAAMIIQRLESQGYQALYVGGFVRDYLLGLPSRDADLATNASPEVSQALFSEAHIELTGKRFQVLRIDGIELATFRGERYTLPGKPEVWQAPCFAEDAARRDFTINAIAMTARGEIIDPFGGREDLARGLLRSVGDPYQRFSEDPLRLLRGINFAVRLGLSIERQTAGAICASAEKLFSLPVERINQEIAKLIEHGVLADGLRLYLKYGLLAFTLPELQHLPGQGQLNSHHHLDAWEHTLMVVEKVSGLAPHNQALAWAAAFHDAGKGVADSAHETKSCQLFLQAAERLKLSHRLTHEVQSYIRGHTTRGIRDPESAASFLIHLASNWRNKAELRLAMENLALLLEADCYGKSPERLEEHLAASSAERELLDEAWRRIPLYLQDIDLRGSDLTGYLQGQAISERLHQELRMQQMLSIQQWQDEISVNQYLH